MVGKINGQAVIPFIVTMDDWNCGCATLGRRSHDSGWDDYDVAMGCGNGNHIQFAYGRGHGPYKGSGVGDGRAWQDSPGYSPEGWEE